MENNQNQNTQPEAENTEIQDQEEVTIGTKIKVVAALAVVGFAAYIAYWIQEPVQIRADVLGSTSMESQMQGNTQEVSIVNFNYDPETLSVEKGTTVVWTNKDTVPHNVVSPTFTSPTLNPGQSFSYTFNDDGSFSYRCTFHPQMKGTVLVGTAAQTQATQSDILQGFGAGSSLGLDTTTSSTTTADTTTITTSLDNAISEQTTTSTDVAADTSAPVTPETLYTTTSPAPGSELHDAALQSLSESLGTINQITSSAAGSVPLYQTGAQTTMPAAENQAMVQNKGKLASSGPEDVLYIAMFGIVLYLNRKKLRARREG